VTDLWSDKAPALVFESHEWPGRRYRLYEMHRESLRLDYAGKTPLTAQVSGQAAEVPDEKDRTDLRWVAHLQRMGLEGAGAFDAKLLDAQGLPAGGGKGRGLAGVVQLASGRLSVDDVVRDEDGDPIAFEFKPVITAGSAVSNAEPVFTQAQGAHVLLEDTFDGDEVRLVFGGHGDGGVDWRSVRVRPLGSRLDLRVVNLELSSILRVGVGYSPGAIGEGAFADNDFAAHYVLSAAWPFTEKVGLPVPHPKGNPKMPRFGGERQTCKGAAFSGLG
jgi:hypothetical protein